MITNDVGEITVAQLAEYENQPCPVCHQGIMRRGMDHDPVSGNQTVLRCDKQNPCAHKIEIRTN